MFQSINNYNWLRKIVKHKLFTDSVIYTSVVGIISAISFLLLPVFTRYLSPHDYGIISTIQVFIGIVSLFICLGVESSIPVNYFRLEGNKFKEYLMNILFLILFTSFIVVSTLYLFRRYVSAFLEISNAWLFFVSLALPFGAVISMAIILLIAQEKVFKRSLFLLFQSIFSAILSLFLVTIIGLKWQGLLLANIVTLCCFSIIGIFIILRMTGSDNCKLNLKYIKAALLFGVPLIPYSISGQIMVGIDRFFINSMVNVSETGIYSVGYRVGMMISLFVSAFNTVWLPFFYKKLAEDRDVTKLKIVKFTYLYCIMIIAVAFLWGLVAPPILKHFVGTAFQGCSKYVMWIGLSYAFEGIYFMGAAYIFYAKKTYILSVIGIISASLNIVFTYVLIKFNGALGAAQATCLTYFAFCIMTWLASVKIYKMPWKLGRPTKCSNL